MAIKNASHPLDDAEFVYRRVHRSQYRPGCIPPLTRGAFTPNPNDVDGLSFYRANDVTVDTLKSAAGKPPDEYVVFRLRVGSFQSLSIPLVLDSKPDTSPKSLPGHYVTPAFNFQVYSDRSQKPKWERVQHELMRIAEFVQ